MEFDREAADLIINMLQEKSDIEEFGPPKVNSSKNPFPQEGTKENDVWAGLGDNSSGACKVSFLS